MTNESRGLESLKFLDSVIENIPHMIFIKDAKDLRFVRFNKAGEDLLGYSRKELIGKNDYDFFPKEEADFFISKDRLVLKGKVLVDIPEEPIHTRFKGIRTLHTKKIPILDEHGNANFLMGISEDITEKMMSEKKLAEIHLERQSSEQQLRALIDNIPGAIYRCACDKDWTMFFVSDVIEEISGYSSAEFVRDRVRSYASVIHEADRQMVEDKVAEGVNKRKPYTIEYRIVHKSGAIRHIYERGQGVFGENDTLLWLDGAIFDITEQKRAQEDLARSNAEKEQMEIFTYLASHDLQEPLQKIISFGELLKTHKTANLDTKAKDYLERMQNAARRMTQLVQDLLNLSRVVTKKPLSQTVDLKKTLQDVLTDLDLRMEKTGARVESDALAVIQADRSQMYQLFQNLISNSLKFRRKGEAPVIVIQSRAAGNGRLEIDFKDNGIGFEGKDTERIFKPFERLHGAGDYEGSGIGLAICQRIVSRHGGSITAQGVTGQGATFTVCLPVDSHEK